MTRHSKNYSHIWDNVMGTATCHHHKQFRAPCDTTGSTVSILDYSRQEITVTTSENDDGNDVATLLVHHKKQVHDIVPQYPQNSKNVEKSRRPEKQRLEKNRVCRDGFVTSLERECAQQPKQLAPWTFSSEQKQCYDTLAASRAFDEYTRRLAAKKKKLEEQLALAAAQKEQRQREEEEHISKKRVTINESATEIVHRDDVPRCRSAKQQHVGEKMNVSHRRNDEIQIDAVCKMRTTTMTMLGASSEQEGVKIQKASPQTTAPKQQPGFYGTIEAEKCAERVAGHISAAAEHLERLQFVAEAVLPESGLHLKTLQQIGDEIRDFNTQMRSRRAKVPKSAGVNQVAHFVITDSSAD